MSADVLKTIALMTAIKTKLAAVAHPSSEGKKLFEVVEFSEDKNLGETFTDLRILKERVCLIVPSGDRYVSRKEGRGVHVDRFTTIDLVFADRAYLDGGQDAAFGGEKNVGVVVMNEIVLETLANDPQLGLAWCGLYPTDGAFVTIAADEAKKLPGRQAFALTYETAAGELTLPFTAPWPAN